MFFSESVDFEKRCCEEMTERSREFYEFMDKRRTVREISTEEIPDELTEKSMPSEISDPEQEKDLEHMIEKEQNLILEWHYF